MERLGGNGGNVFSFLNDLRLRFFFSSVCAMELAGPKKSSECNLAELTTVGLDGRIVESTRLIPVDEGSTGIPA
jgi:hypothetical protein